MQKVNKATANVNLSPCLSTTTILAENTKLHTLLLFLALDGGEKSTSHISFFTTAPQWSGGYTTSYSRYSSENKVSNIAAVVCPKSVN
jgi:hypothetical protein